MTTNNTKLNAAVKFYLDTVKYGNNSYNVNSDYTYPTEHDNLNRLGQNWNVFDVDISSKINNIRHNDLISLKIENPWFVKKINQNLNFKNDYSKYSESSYSSDTYFDLNDLYFLIFKNYNFVFKFFKDDNKIELSDIIVEKTENTTYYGSRKYIKFKFKKSDNTYYKLTDFNKVKIYLNEDFANKDIVYSELQLTSEYEMTQYSYQEMCTCDSMTISNDHKIIPIMFYDENDEVLNNITLTYEIDKTYNVLINSNNGLNNPKLSISLADKSKKISYEAKYIEFILGADTEFTKNEITYKDNTSYSGNLTGENSVNKYFYWLTEELSNYTYEINGDSVKLYSNIYLNEFDKINGNYKSFTINSKDIRKFESHFIEIDKNNYFIPINKSEINEKTITVNVKNVSTDESSNENIVIFKRSSLKYNELINDKVSHKKLQQSNPELLEVKDEDGNIYTFKKDVTLWNLNSLEIYFNQKFSNKNLILTFKSIEMTKQKTELGIKSVKTEHPFISLYEDDNEIYENFFYSHDQETGEYVTFFFKFDPNDDDHKDKEYKFRIIDYQRIYDFNVTETNYFDKNLNFKISSFINYDGEMPIGNYIVNVIENDEIIGSVSNQYFKISYGSTYADLDYELTNYESTSLVVPENRTYDIQVKTLYRYQDFYEFVELSNKEEYVDFSTSSTIKYGFQFPYVNFYGYFTDSLGHKLNEIPELIENSPSGYFDDEIQNLNDSSIYYIDKAIYLKYSDNISGVTLKIENDKFTYITSSELQTDGRYDFDVNQNQFVKGYDFCFKETLKNNSNSYRNYSIYPGTYDISLYVNNQLAKNYGSYEISKENEKNGAFYGIKFEWPNVNVIGKVVNKSNGEIIHKKGMKVRFKNNETSKINDFTYAYKQSSIYSYDDGTNSNEEGFVEYFSQNSYNYYQQSYAWTDRFQFLFQGFNSSPRIYTKTTTLRNKHANSTAIYSSPSLESGYYEVSLLDENENLISTYFNNLEVSKSKQSELYNLELEFPLCKFEGCIKDNLGNTLYSDGLKIVMENINDSSKSEEFEYHVYNTTYNQYRTTFEFNSLGKELVNFTGNESIRYFKEDDDTPYLLGQSYYSRGLTPGEYKINVLYKGKELQILNGETITISKEKEANDELNNYEIKVSSIYASLSGYVVDNTFGNKIEQSLFKMNILDENYDGDLSNDFTDTTNQKTSGPSAIFKFYNIMNLGYYKVDLYQRDFINVPKITSDMIKIDIKDFTDLNNKSVYLSAGSENGHPNYDLFDITKLSIDDGFRKGIIYAKNWYYPLYKEFKYVDEHLNESYTLNYSYQYDTTEYKNKSVSNTFVEANPYIETVISYKNTSLNEESSINGFTLGSYYGASTSLTTIDYVSYLYKSGKYELTLKSKNYDVNNLCTKTFNLSALIAGDSYYNYDKYSESLGFVSLNMNVLIWRDDLNKYETLKGYYNGSSYYNNLMSSSFTYKLNDEDNLSSYYSTSYQYGSDYINYQMFFPTNSKGQRKFILPGLINQGKYKYELLYGGTKNEAHKVKFKGLYKSDISNGYTTDANILDGISLKTLVKTYVIPTDEEVLNEIDSLLEDKIGSSKYNKVYKFGESNDFSEINSELTTSINSLLNSTSYTDRNISSYLSSSIEDMFVNHLDENNLIDISTLGLTNPNSYPTKYYSLVVDELCMNIIGEIRFNDNGILKLHDFAEFGNPLKLKIYDKNGNLERTIYNRASMFIIPMIKSGYHKFVITMYDHQIYENEFYIYDLSNIDIVIDQANFTDVPVSGLLKFNSGDPIDITHVTVFNNDLNTYYYSGNYNGTDTYDMDSDHSLNFDKAFDTYSTNTYESKSISGIYTAQDSSYYSCYRIMTQYPTDLQKYSSDNQMTFNHYRLHDLLPGNYTIKYFINPVSINELTYYHSAGDSSIIKSISDNISSLVCDHESFYIKKSDIKYYSSYYYSSYEQDNNLRSQIDFDKFTVMKAKLLYSLNTYGGSSTVSNRKFKVEDYDENQKYHMSIYQDSWNSDSNYQYYMQEGQNWLNLNFECEKCQYENEDAFKITILNNDIPQNNDITIKDVKFEKLNIVFGELINQQTIDISKTTSLIPEINLDKQYCQKLVINIKNLNYKSFKESNSYFKLFDENNNEIENCYFNENDRWYNSDYSPLTVTFYGLKTGTYTIKAYENIENSELFSIDNIIVDDSIVVKDYYPEVYSMNLTFKDASLNNSICTSSKAIRIYNQIDNSNILNNEGSFNVTSSYTLGNLRNGTYNILVHDSAYSTSNASGVNVFYDYTGNKCITPLSSVTINGEDLNKDIVVPYQLFNFNISFYDLKSNQSISNVPNGIYMTLTRKNGDKYDETLDNYKTSYGNIKSGLYSIQYRTINYGADSGSNGSLISYCDQYIDSNKTFKLYEYVSIIDNMTITLKESYNGAINVTSNCINKEVMIYDENGNLYRKATTNSEGKITIATIPNLIFKFGVDGYSTSNNYSQLADSNKNITLVMNSNNTITFGN